MNREPGIKHFQLFIDGKHVAPSGGTYSLDIDPATEEVIGMVAEGDKADVDLAVSAARAALKRWGAMRAAERGRILQRAAALLEEHQEELIKLESRDAGKPLASVRRQDMAAVLDTVRYYAGWCDKITGQVIPARPDALTYTVREPVGVVAAIVPWNFPLMIGMWKIAPALACGCTVVVKPAELTPLSLLRVAELFLEAGLPAGALNVV
ncbi:MAG TPA: aldehyde dehydrogenase family protein, partial [Steroidobacteraceae bacterium]